MLRDPVYVGGGITQVVRQFDKEIETLRRQANDAELGRQSALDSLHKEQANTRKAQDELKACSKRIHNQRDEIRELTLQLAFAKRAEEVVTERLRLVEEAIGNLRTYQTLADNVRDICQDHRQLLEYVSTLPRNAETLAEQNTQLLGQLKLALQYAGQDTPKSLPVDGFVQAANGRVVTYYIVRT